MGLLIIALAVQLSAPAASGASFPAVQVVPLPGQQFTFEIGGDEVAHYHGGEGAPKPFLFPLIGPAGKRLTAMAHPTDPHGHRHHRSVWAGHRDVNGHNFWEEDDGNRIVMTRLEGFGHDEKAAWLRAAHEWRASGGEVIVNERRTWRMTKLDGGEYYLDVTLAFSVAGGPVTFGQTPFGFLGVRVTPTMSVSGGGGRILNSEGALNEAGVHWKPARWVDFSGPVAPDTENGVALFDHPDNPGHPVTFHVRDEGWMGASFTYGAPCTIQPEETLVLQYRIYVHGPEVAAATLDAHWAGYAAP